MNLKTTVAFPSLDWFRALQERMNAAEERYRTYGYADARVVFKIDANDRLPHTRLFGLVFETYGCAEVRELQESDTEGFDCDFILQGPYKAWREMIENVQANGQADPDHTLNRLSLLQHPFSIHGTDQLRVDLFFRQQFSFQAFIDESAAVETSFPTSG